MKRYLSFINGGVPVAKKIIIQKNVFERIHCANILLVAQVEIKVCAW